MKAVYFLLVCLILATAVVAGPLGSVQSVDGVNECSQLTRFREGYRYTFRYEGETESGITGAGPGSTMTMACDVIIEAPESCRNVLKVTSCNLDESPELALEMSTYDLVFRTDKGRIVEVLAHPDEPTHILNTKRGILSMLQLDLEADDVDQTTLNEVSVHGNCSSEMTVTRRDSKERPRKLEVVTDLNNCMLKKWSDNMTMWQSFKDIVLNTTVVDKFINSSKTCSYDLKGTTGEFKGIECEEIHSFWPMNFNSESGVRTFIQQSIISTTIETLNYFKIDPSNTRSTSLRYEHDPKEIGRKPDDVTADQAIDVLKALVKSSREEVKMESPRLFGRWRAALEGMNNETIHEVFDRAYNCSAYSQTCRDNPDKEKIAREYLLDGLLPCTTMACFSVKNYAIAKGVVPKPLASAWMVTMALQNYPTLELMSEMLRMAQYAPSQITIFPLSIMVHNYWMNNMDIQTEAALPEPIIMTIKYLKSLIGYDCTGSTEDERLTLIALKALGNIGEPIERFDETTVTFSEHVSPALLRCAKNKQIPRDISKAAIQSMRRFVMADHLRYQVISQLFKDTTLDVPQRIAAYLLAMKSNPSNADVSGIWEFLKTEPVNQMKAFCYSHIQNVIESSEPTLQELQQTLKMVMGNEELPEYPKDIRKFSRYFELSKNFTDPWKNNTVAAQFESDMIFSPESYLPQEVMFHYVLNALGKSWDMFETGIEMKGFEPVLESVFGPDGFFPEVSLQNMIDTIDEKFLSKVREFAEAQLAKLATPESEPNTNVYIKKDKFKKAKRQAPVGEPQVVDLIHENTMNKLTQLHYLVGMEPSATDATIFLRLFGNEFGFVSASDVLALIPYTMGIYEDLINKTKQIPQLLSQGLNLNTTRSVVFMDKSFIIPTGMGMPLNCSMNGTAVVSLRIKSQFSIKLPKIIAAGHIAPSGAVEVLATMGIGLPTKVFTGVMANATVYHSSKIAGNITIDGTHLKINLNNTDRPMNLFNYSTTYNLLKANGEIESIPGVLQDAVKRQRCTNVSKVLGVDLCVSWAYPNTSSVAEAPRFPFAGPNSFNVTLVNTDKALKAYTIDAQYKQIKEGGAPASISFSSIGRKNKRSTQAVTKLIDTIRVSFYAPGEELTRNITSLMTVDRLRKTAKWTFTVPEVKNFVMFAGILNETNESSSSYRAVFNVSAAENTASVDFLVRNETSMTQKNLTAVFNASINSLYFATVGQFVMQSSSGNWDASLTETYYWDNETPLYKQLLFPWTEYEINHAKYQTSTISAERRTRGPVVHRDMKMETLGWAFDLTTEQTVTDRVTDVTMRTKISNDTWTFPLVDVRLRNETKTNGYRFGGQIARNTHHVYADYDLTMETGETNHNTRFGLRTDVLVDNPDAAMFMNSPVLLQLFGETALIDEPVVLNGGVNIRVLDQSQLADEQYLIQTAIFVPNPMNMETNLRYDFDLRLENATISNKKDYSLELTTPMPFLKMNNVNFLHLAVDMETGTSTMDHSYTLYDTRYSKPQATMSNTFSVGWKKPSANWVMNINALSMAYFQNYTALYSTENGMQFLYETSQDSSVYDLLDFNDIGNLSVKPSAMSMYWSIIHQLMTTNVSNSLVAGGPITEMRPRVVPAIMRDILNKTISRDFTGVKDLVLNNFIYNITSSSLTLRQSANLYSPLIANMSASHYIFLSQSLFDQKLVFAAEQKRLNISTGLNHSLVIEDREMTLKTEGNLKVRSGLRMNTLTSVNMTIFKPDTPFDMAALHFTEVDSPLIKFSTRSSSNGDINEALNMVANHNTTMSSKMGSFDVIGNFNIDEMSAPTFFNEMTGILTYKLKSRMIKSSLNSSVSFETFRKLFKFQKVLVKASHDIKSNLVNWNAHGQSQLKGFSSITEFDEVSSNIEANLLNKLVSGSHSSGMVLRDMNGPLMFTQFKTYLGNNITSKFINSTYETQMDLQNSDVSFTSLDGSSNYVLTSRLMNVTANNTMLMGGFRGLFNFDSVTGKQIWFVKSSLLNAIMDNVIVMTNFQNISFFDEISGHVSGNMESRLAEGNTNTTLLIQNVRSPMAIAKVAIDSSSTFSSRLMNSSMVGGFDITNHRSLLNFDSISSEMNFTYKVINVSTSVQNEVRFNGMRSFANFDSITHLMAIAANSYYLNTSITERISLQNFRYINQFDLASAEVISTFNTFPLKTSYHQSHKIEEMSGWFQYPLAETVIIGNLTTPKLNMSGSYEGRIVDMTAPFQFDSSIAKIEYGVKNMMLNITGFHGVEVDRMRGMLHFRRVNGTISHQVNTPVMDMTISGLLDMRFFQSLFRFELMNMETSNIFTVIPLTTTFASYNGALALEGFEKFNNFDSITGMSKTAVVTKWTNWTMNIDSTVSAVRSVMKFDKLVISGQNEFTSPFIVMISNTTNFVIDSDGFFSASNATTSTMFGVTSRIAKIDTSMKWSVRDLTGPFAFAANVFSTNFNVSTPVIKTGSAVDVEMDNWRNVTTFGKYEIRAANDIYSRIAQWNVLSRFRLDNMAGLLTYSRMEGSASSKFSSIISSLNASINAHINNQAGLLTYEEMVVSTQGNFSSRPVKMQGATDFNIQNMEGIMTFDSMTGSASAMMNSNLVSMEGATDFNIQNMAGFMTYDSMTGSASAMMNSSLVSMEGATDFNIQNMEGFMTFDSITGSVSLIMNSRFLNSTTKSNLLANTGTGLFKVQLANVTAAVSVDTPVTNEMKASASAQVTDSNNLFQFGNAVMKGKLSVLTSVINVTSNADSIMTNFVNITNFESAESSAEMNVASRFFNSSTRGTMQMHGFERLFRFADVKIGGYTTISSILASLTSEAGIDFTNFQSMFTFDRVNISALVSMTSRLANIDGKTGMEMNNFRGPTTFDRVNGSLISNFKSKLVNSTTMADYSLEHFDSLFRFSRVAASAESLLNNRLVNGTVMVDYSLTDSTSFCNFAKLEANAAGSMMTRFVAGKALGIVKVNNARNLTSFDLFNMTSEVRLISKPMTAMTETVYVIKNHRNLLNFDEVSSRMLGNIKNRWVNISVLYESGMKNSLSLLNFESVTNRMYGHVMSRWLNSTAVFESQMNSSRSLLNFDAAKSKIIFTLLTHFNEAVINGQLNFIDFKNITHFGEVSAMVVGNATGPVGQASGISRLNITNMSGLMSFERALMDSYAKLESLMLNSTIKNTVLLKGFQGMQYSYIGNSFLFLWADPMNDVTVKNGLDLTTLRDMTQLFNITWVNPKGTVVFNQRLNYENLVATIKLPSIGLISAGANLNTFGDILTFYIEHELLKDNFKTVNDITWLLKLNESNVIYSNFSWNPETVAEIVDITVGAINNTFNRTITIANSTINRIMEVANRTLTNASKMTNCTKCFMRYTMMLANETLNATFSQLNQTFFNQVMKLNETFFIQLNTLNQTMYTQLMKLNQTLYMQFQNLSKTFYIQMQKLNDTITFARSNPREFIGTYVNITKLNKEVTMLSGALRDIYNNIRYSISNPMEALEEIKTLIKTLIKYEERRQQIASVIENRDVYKTRAVDYLKEVQANLTKMAVEVVETVKEFIQYEAKVETLINYINTRFNVPKFQEKIDELKLKIAEIRSNMTSLQVKVGEKMNDMKLKMAFLNKENLKAEMKARINMIKNFIRYFFNSTTTDIISSSIFIDYQDDAQVQELMRKVIRIRPRNAIDIINMTSVAGIKDQALEMKDNLIVSLEKLNQTTFRYVNKTYLNETAKQVIEMMKEWNSTLHEYVYIDVIKGDLKLVFNFTREKVANMTKAVTDFVKTKANLIQAFLKEQWDARPRSLEELKERLMAMKVIAVDYIRERYNIDVDQIIEKIVEKIMNEYTKRKIQFDELVIRMSDEYLKRKEQLDEVIVQMIDISMNETHPINMLPLCYFNRTIYQIVQPPVNMTMNLTVLYSKLALNFTQVYRNKVANLTKVYYKEVANFTKVYARIGVNKMKAFSKIYTPMVIKAMNKYQVLAVEKGKIAKERAIMFFNITKGNVTLYYQKYSPIVNEAIRNYTIYAREALFNYTVQVRNITETYINMTIEFLEPHVQPYREIMMQKVEMMKVRAANLKERVRQLPAQTETYLMEAAEYHIERYPQYKQNTIQMIEELKVKLEEVKVNLTRLYTQMKTNLTLFYGDLKQNATDLYIAYSQKAQEVYLLGKDKVNTFKTKVQGKWQTWKPIIIRKSGKFLNATKLNINKTLEAIISAAKDEYSLINELPMRALDKTIFELNEDLKVYLQQLKDNLIENAKMSIKNRESLLNKLPVMYLNMTVIEVGNFSYGKILVASNLTKFYTYKTLTWANTTMLMANETFYNVLIVSNNTIREVVIPFLNQTTMDLIVFMNRTRFQPWMVSINETIDFLNQTSVVLMNKANETVVIVQTKAVAAWKNLTSDENIAKMKMYLNNTRDMIIKRLQDVNETIYMIRNMTTLNINKTIEAIISAAKDESSLINLLPVRVLDKTIFELNEDLKAYLLQLKETLKDRESLLNKYPVMYLNMTVFEVSNLSFRDMLAASNLTFYDALIVSNKTIREVVIPFLNQTSRDLIVFMNRTRSQPWRVTVNETLSFLNETSVVLMNKANETVVIVQTKAIAAWKNLTSDENIAKMKMYLNSTKDLVIKSLTVANETIYMISNRSINLVIYVRDETPLFNISRDYALLATNLTKSSINQARNITAKTIYYARNMTNTIVTYIQGPAKDYIMEYVTYVNNSMAGWAIRYYEVDQFTMKAGAYIVALKPVERTINLTMIAINRTRLLTEMAYNRSQVLAQYALNQTRILTDYALNQTRVITQYAVNQTQLLTSQAINKTSLLTKQAINRTRTLIRDTLDLIDRQDNHSFAINITHPFNWTSFRTLPRLSNNQIQYFKDKMSQMNITVQEMLVIMTERYNNISHMAKAFYQLQKPMIDENIEAFMNKLIEIRNKIQEKFDQYKEVFNEYKAIFDEKKEEIMTKWEDEIKPKINEMITNLTRFVRDPEMLTKLKQMAYEFRTETLPEMKRILLEEKYPELKRVIMEEKYPELKRQVLAQYESAKVIFEELKQNATVLRENITAKVDRLRVRAMEMWTELIEKIEEIRQNLPETLQFPMIDENIEVFRTKLEEIRTKIQEKIDQYKEIFNEYKEIFDEKKEFYQQKWETEWKPTLMEKREEIMTKWEEEIKPEINEMIADFETLVKDPELLTNLRKMIYEFITETLPELTTELLEEELPELKRIILEEKYPELKRVIMEETYPELKRKVLSRYEGAKAVFEELKQNVTMIRENIMARIETLRVQAMEKWTELLENVENFRQSWPEKYEKLKADIEDLKLQLNNKMSEYINKVLTVLQELRIPVELLPFEEIEIYSPWRYTAMIFGRNNIMTFDGKVYSVPAYANEEQTYLLARDFINRNFTLLVQKRRITLAISDMSVAIDDDNVVYINGLPNVQELPYQTPISKDMTIMAEGPWVNITSTKGIAFSCNVDHSLCIFHMSGWYHGQSRGLFGNLDTEYHNEFVLPEGDITNDIAEFISAYDVSPYDMPRNTVPSRLGLCRSIPEKCRDMFLDDGSMLNETFQDINQTEFYNFCVEQTKACNPTCEATNPVVTLGKEFERMVNYDPVCLDCTIGEVTQENDRSTSSADVIFIVSETARMAEDNNIKANIKNIINRINNKLRAFGVNNVRYGLVGYSGAEIHERAHVHTLCGHVMDRSIDCVYSGVESLDFQGVIQLDAMKALHLASTYPFNKEAAKIIVLIADDDVVEESTSRLDALFSVNVTVAATQKRLERQGICLNVFSSYQTLNKKSTDSPILGVNYLGQQIINKKTSGEAGTDRLAIPKGQYAKLAKATRGSVLGLSWLQSGHRDLNIMLPRMIWKQQVQPQATGQVDFMCRCVIGMYGESRNECQITRFVDGVY